VCCYISQITIPNARPSQWMSESIENSQLVSKNWTNEWKRRILKFTILQHNALHFTIIDCATNKVENEDSKILVQCFVIAWISLRKMSTVVSLFYFVREFHICRLRTTEWYFAESGTFQYSRRSWHLNPELCISILHIKPFPSSLPSLFQSEAKCGIVLMWMKNWYSQQRLALK